MSDYQHDIFFEANNLSEDDKRRIRQYFQIKRRSGGGECGEVEKVGENTYKIAFKKEKDLERVLSRTDHTVQLAKQRNLHILLCHYNTQYDNKTPPDSQVVSDSKQVEKILKLDPYLLRFLSDSPTAGLDLKNRLSSLSSSFKVDLDFEKMVIKRDGAQSGEDDVALQKWEAEVEDIFLDLQERYLIHFEVEQERLMTLKQNPFSSTENLGIYKEGSITVFVGESTEIEKLLKVLDTLQLQQQVCKNYTVSEKQYELVKERFEQEIKSKFSGIEITHGRPDAVVLKGPEEHVQAAGKTLQELVNQIQEKKILLPHPLLTFLSSSGAVQRFQERFQQSLRSLVLLETRGSDLILLSLSMGALQEAATAVQRDLCMESVPLERFEAESPGIDTLKQALSQALQQANHGSKNVELNYEPSTNVDSRMKVQLVGFSTEVGKLKNVIQDYKKNHVTFSDSLPLRLPEMVDRFSDLLTLVDVKANHVNLVPTLSPSACVQLSGPLCEVKDLKEKLDFAFGCLIWNISQVDGPGVVQYFQDDGLNTQESVQNSFHVVIVPKINAQGGPAKARTTERSSLPNLSTTVASSYAGANEDSSVALEIVFESLEEQKVDILVAPMLTTTLKSTKVGICLLNKGGQRLKCNFKTAKGKRRLTPGDVLEVDGTPLGCKKVFFIECVSWTGNTNNSEKALRDGLERVLALCKQQGWASVAVPVIGPGPALSVPVKDATSILTKAIGKFGEAGNTGSLRTIRITIMPNYSNSEEIYEGVCTGLSAQLVDPTGRAVFQSLSSEIDEITFTAGSCQLHLVFGDISNEITDVIVNTTDFSHFNTDVCNEILTVAGPQVQADLKGVQINKGEIFSTQPGNFPCKAIMHVCGQSDTEIIKGLAKDIVLKCERDRHQSVAIPAICAGIGGLGAKMVAQSVLGGVKDATIHNEFRHLKTIRIVLWKINVFLEFKAVAQKLFGNFTKMTAPAPLKSLTAATRGHQPQSMTTDLGSFVQSLPEQQESKAQFLVIGSTAENVSNACQELRRSYEKECFSRVFSLEEIKVLGENETTKITSNLDSLGIEIKQRGPHEFVVRGLTRGVNEVINMVQAALLRQVRERDQDDIFARVSWCILGSRGDWERLPKEAHHQLENKNVAAGVHDAQGQKWNVSLVQMEATAVGATNLTAKLKRLENLPDFTLPLYWDNMAPGELLRVVLLPSSSAEFRRVKAGFKTTVQKTVLKIERIQNVHLRRAYEVRKKELEEKNGPPVGAGEKVLYHGTKADACLSIQQTNFNRSFAGQNATLYGLGTYFALDASYSANPTYSVPAADGTQLMFVALVLTGHYTQGQNDMRTPPPRSTQDPNNHYDSVVNNMQKPDMFVVFHDCQAYPDYLITFQNSGLVPCMVS